MSVFSASTQRQPGQMIQQRGALLGRQRPSLVVGPQMNEAIARLDENLEVPYDVLGILARCFGHLLLSRLDDQTFIHHKHCSDRCSRRLRSQRAHSNPPWPGRASTTIAVTRPP